jgi:rhodanese-related sulfurtransferase
MHAASITLYIALALIAAFFLFRKMKQLPIAQAREWIGQKQAVLVDVRSPSEHRSDPVPGAINLPLNAIGSSIEKQVPDRSTKVICFCLSGMRSASAVALLRQKGYDAYNLGGNGNAHKLSQGPSTGQ